MAVGTKSEISYFGSTNYNVSIVEVAIDSALGENLLNSISPRILTL